VFNNAKSALAKFIR